MTINYVPIRAIEMPKGETVTLKYWADETRVYLAGFDENGKQVSDGLYAGNVENVADDFYQTTGKSLINGLADVAESDLINNPDLHYKPK